MPIQKKNHNMMSSRHRQNVINLVHVEGERSEGVQNIRSTIFHHFSNHFKYVNGRRPGVEDLNF